VTAARLGRAVILMSFGVGLTVAVRGLLFVGLAVAVGTVVALGRVVALGMAVALDVIVPTVIICRLRGRAFVEEGNLSGLEIGDSRSRVTRTAARRTH
jgi:hypothetical protein